MTRNQFLAECRSKICKEFRHGTPLCCAFTGGNRAAGKGSARHILSKFLTLVELSNTSPSGGECGGHSCSNLRREACRRGSWATRSCAGLGKWLRAVACRTVFRCFSREFTASGLSSAAEILGFGVLLPARKQRNACCFLLFPLFLSATG